ncbi:Uncharacterized conserved protein, DUF2267 family [Marinobacter daqiaonensis]|uniref:Uncharacterized conserved protein, DUF2267 family n=1 Tax=Marinobacter daqiaonensis TaxID=650891 RepID=A0A1I6GY11_9GAMM|nr:DUF2267 domain-containing protein [Marinobacter daqiaonensis]SFR47133.1 Uncharacterized conserved protein, DUF2267 family [Marinobacter daqiaonensis]
MQRSIDIIDRNIVIINTWLKDISEEIGDIDEEQAWGRLRAVLLTVRDRIETDEAIHFGAQLPIIVRGLFYEQWKPTETPRKWRHRDEYLEAVNSNIDGPDIDAELTVKAVLKVMDRHLEPGELKKVKEMHSKEVWDLWPE